MTVYEEDTLGKNRRTKGAPRRDRTRGRLVIENCDPSRVGGLLRGQQGGPASPTVPPPAKPSRPAPVPTAGTDLEVVRPTFKAYLRTVWSQVWAAVRHPTKTTEIDLLTGRIVRHI